jgi:hypothetical protein
LVELLDDAKKDHFIVGDDESVQVPDDGKYIGSLNSQQSAWTRNRFNSRREWIAADVDAIRSDGPTQRTLSLGRFEQLQWAISIGRLERSQEDSILPGSLGSTYGSKYVAARTAIEQNTGNDLSLSYLGVPVEESFMFGAVHTIMFNPLGSDKFTGRLPVVDKMEPPVHDMSLETEFVTNLTIVFMRHTAVYIRHSVRKRRTYTAFSRESVTSLSTEATYVENMRCYPTMRSEAR